MNTLVFVGGEVQRLCVSTDEWLCSIGYNIKIRRESKHLSQEKLGEMMNVSDKTIKRHEKGKCLTFDIIPVYAAALGCTPEELLLSKVNCEDPVIRACFRIKDEPEKVQRLLLGNLENSFNLLKLK